MQATIEDLHKENENLRKENQELRDEISNLKSQISDLTANQAILMKSFQRENKLALRKMVDDAKKKGLQSFPINAQDYIRTKSVKNDLISAAHVFIPARIKEAIYCEQKTTKKAVLLSMWNILYQNDEILTTISQYNKKHLSNHHWESNLPRPGHKKVPHSTGPGGAPFNAPVGAPFRDPGAPFYAPVGAL